MRCKKCGEKIDIGAKECPNCGAPVKSRLRGVIRFAFFAVVWILSIALFIFVANKIYSWYSDYQINRLYARGAYKPSVAEVTLDDGRAGHAITFYGKDGDSVFIEMYNRSIMISGGVARIEIPDSEWFGSDVELVESADVSISAMLIYQKGDKLRLPAVSFSVNSPESPIAVISPSENDIAVNTSIYPLEVQVVPGSEVSVNGNDVTDIVDRNGRLSVNVNVFPIGDNTYALIVKTPNHKEARQDILIYRAKMEIAVEVNSTVPTSTSSDVVTISGKCDPGALISVDTEYVENSITQDMQAGTYEFIAKMSVIGDNVVRFRAAMDGKADSVISLTINYLPNIDYYSRKAWAMDYKDLRMMFEQWTGRIFLCEGKVIDIVYEDETQYVIMDVGKDGVEQLLALDNQSSVGTPSRGKEYKAYADVNGRYMYNDHYYPLLIARYMDVKEVN